MQGRRDVGKLAGGAKHASGTTARRAGAVSERSRGRWVHGTSATAATPGTNTAAGASPG